MQPDLDGGGAQQVAHVGQADGDAVVDLGDLVVGAGDHVGHDAVHVVQIVQGLHCRLAGALGLAALPLGLLHLDVGRVAQHDVAQLHRGGAGIDRAAEALLPQQRQQARVVDVGVGQQHEVQLRRGDGDGLVFKEVAALLHAVVHQALLVAHLQIGTAPRDLMGGAEKRDLHKRTSVCFSALIVHPPGGWRKDGKKDFPFSPRKGRMEKKGGEALERYRSLNRYLRETYGEKLYKLALDGGFTCPNRDGTLGTGGCSFCSGRGSGDFAESCRDGVPAAVRRAERRVAHKNPGGRYIAYFQSFSATYAPEERLRALYTEALSVPEVAVLSVATRPDCLPEETVGAAGGAQPRQARVGGAGAADRPRGDRPAHPPGLRAAGLRRRGAAAAMRRGSR